MQKPESVSLLHSSLKQRLLLWLPAPGWAEQDPQNWWENLKLSTQAVMAGSGIGPDGIAAIGISYQMHGTGLCG